MMSLRPRLIAALALTLPLLIAKPQSRAVSPVSGPSTVAEQFLFRSVNSERAAAGLPPLLWNGTLSRAAYAHAEQMGSSLTLSHQLPGEADLVQRASSVGAHFSRVTKNVAVGPSLAQMHDALMHSQHHRENILDPSVNSVAIAVTMRAGNLWAVEDFEHDQATLTYDQQEQQVLTLLLNAGVAANATNEARETCGKSSGYSGTRPGFVMRYATSDLQRLPEQITVRLAPHQYTSASVGACKAPSGRGFTSYSIAVLLYR